MNVREIKKQTDHSQKTLDCRICGYTAKILQPGDYGRVRGNTAKFKDRLFSLWQCSQCGTIQSADLVDSAEIYKDYPLNHRRMDFFARVTLGNLLRRLKKAGLKKSDSILDYGCGNGLFIQFLKSKGFKNVQGFDPYVPTFSTPPDPALRFDCVVFNDSLEHCEDVHATLQDCAYRLKPGGILYIGTPDTKGVDIKKLDRHVTKLHQPFHRILVNFETLKKLGIDLGFYLMTSYQRSYLDTRVPFCNYRFLDEFCKALDHNLDAALDPSSRNMILRRPHLLFWIIRLVLSFGV